MLNFWELTQRLNEGYQIKYPSSREDIEAITNLLQNREDPDSVRNVFSSRFAMRTVVDTKTQQFVGIYFFNYNNKTKSLTVPLIHCANIPEAQNVLIADLFNTARKTSKRAAIVVKCHTDDIEILSALSKHGFGIQKHGSDYVAMFPKTTAVQGNPFSGYDKAKQDKPPLNQPQAPPMQQPQQQDDDGPEDEYGLFKDLPWRG